MGLKADIDLSIIKPLLSLNERSDGDVLHRLNSVYDGMLNNPAYPNPPVDMAGFKAVIDAYTTAAAAAQHDGGKNAIIERDKRRADAIIMCRLLGHYVEPACQNDLKTFASSGSPALPRGNEIHCSPSLHLSSSRLIKVIRASF